MEEILPNIKYNKGFLADGKVLPYYSFNKPLIDDGWNNELEYFLRDTSKNHFLDIYNRQIVFDAINKYINKNADTSFIDIGCSSGYLLEEVSAKYASFDNYGADYYVEGLDFLHQKLPQIPLFQMDILKCDWKDNLFDIATMLNVLEHIKDDTAVLKRIIRLLKPNGILIMSVPMYQSLFDAFDEVHQHKRRYEMKDLKSMIKAAGFKTLWHNYFGTFIFPGFYFTKKLARAKTRSYTMEQKIEFVSKEIHYTSLFPLSNVFCNLEHMIGRYVRYPFGVRAYFILQKGS